ncbi:MAG TPA: sigma factor [Candidatus Dormibacteraeota bacterium]|nr:sigma factor [Candidatus Dormibacteraeota bacterium]
MWHLSAQEEIAVGGLYDRHAAVEFGLALRMLRDPASAEEVGQDAFVSLRRRASAHAPDRTGVRTWLLTLDTPCHISSMQSSAAGPEPFRRALA